MGIKGKGREKVRKGKQAQRPGRQSRKKKRPGRQEKSPEKETDLEAGRAVRKRETDLRDGKTIPIQAYKEKEIENYGYDR